MEATQPVASIPFETLTSSSSHLPHLPSLPFGTPCCSLNAPTLTFPSTQHELEFKPCRYARLRESAQSYMVNQVGVSCFKYVPQGAKGPRGEEGPGYVASTFNFYVFPEPLKDSSQVSDKRRREVWEV